MADIFLTKRFSFLPGRSFLKILRKILSLNPESRLKSSGRFLVEIHGELLETVLYWRRQGSPPPPHSPHTLELCLKLLSPKERGCGGFDGVVGGVWWSMFAQGEGSSVQHSHPPKRSSSSQRSQSSLTQPQENLSLEEMGFFNVWNGWPVVQLEEHNLHRLRGVLDLHRLHCCPWIIKKLPYTPPLVFWKDKIFVFKRKELIIHDTIWVLCNSPKCCI